MEVSYVSLDFGFCILGEIILRFFQPIFHDALSSELLLGQFPMPGLRFGQRTQARSKALAQTTVTLCEVWGSSRWNDVGLP